MTAWDGSGMKRAPFDPFGGESRTLPYTYRHRPGRRHGPTCQPSNPEIGCECGYAEWLEERKELRWLEEALATAPDARDADQTAAVAYYLAHGGAR